MKRFMPQILKLVLVCAVFTACSATPPPKLQRVTHHPLLNRPGGVLLMVDSCIQYDALGDDDDYFMIEESTSGAQALLDVATKYLKDDGVPVRAILPFVCGARHGLGNTPEKVADRLNGTVISAQQPYGISDEIKSDREYVGALSILATYVFQHAATQKKSSDSNASSGQLPDLVSSTEFKRAVAVIQERTRASSILYLGVAGTSLSPGKVAAQKIIGAILATGVGFATAAMSTGYYLLFIPGNQIDGRIMGAGLVDLESSDLAWGNAVRAGGDPMKPEVVSNPDALTLLLRDLMYRLAP